MIGGIARTESTDESSQSPGTLRIHPSFTSAHVIERAVTVWLSALRSKRLYFGCGTHMLDSLYAPTQALVDSFLVARDFPADPWTSRQFEGAEHHEQGAARFDSVATFLLPTP